jgi:hypothetical protein
MKKIIILGLSLLLASQASAFGVNVASSVNTGNRDTKDCIVTKEYAPACAIRMGDTEPHTYSNKSEAICDDAVVIYDGVCDKKNEKPQKTQKAKAKHENIHEGLDMFMLEELQKKSPKGKNGAISIEKEIQADINSKKMNNNGKTDVSASVDGDENELELNVDVKVSSDEVRKNITLNGQVDSATEVKLEKNEEGKVYYSVKGEKKGKFLGLFSVNMNVEAKVDAESGEVLSVKTPWYSIFLF